MREPISPVAFQVLHGTQSLDSSSLVRIKTRRFSSHVGIQLYPDPYVLIDFDPANPPSIYLLHNEAYFTLLRTTNGIPPPFHLGVIEVV